MNLSTILLDRDGVINRKIDKGYVTKVEDLEFINETFEFLSALNDSNLHIGIITNQQCIAKGLLTPEDLEAIHEQVSLEFEKRKLSKPVYWICPHFEGTCNCRKPNSLMLNQAISFFESEASSTLMIGDSYTDIMAAHAAGIEAIHLNSECTLQFCTAKFHTFHEFLEISNN